jgi:2-polyprenyl-3-methyl-5-hydroxy-6-metoxy-1,4-benzoquinol methylase
MIATPQDMSALSFQLSSSLWTFGAIGLLFESDVCTHLREPATADEIAAKCPTLPKSRIERCLAVAALAGVLTVDGGRYKLSEGAQCFSQPPMRAVIRGEVRATLLQVVAYLDSATGEASGWRHTNHGLLQAQGDASAGFVAPFKMMLVGMLGDLAQRLERPGARMLDVGVGVGSLAMGMCRAFPALGVVGVDPYDVPLSMARENVTRAGLGERIELRQVRAEELRDEEAFDLAWLPSFFIPATVIETAVARVHAALRPGGWVLFPTGASSGDARAQAVVGLVTESWGGPTLSVSEGEAMLGKAGFSTVRQLPGPPWAPALLAAQR